MEPYKKLQPNAGDELPITEEVASRIVILPTGTAVNPKIINKICKFITNSGHPMISFMSPHELESIGFKSISKNVLINRKASIYDPK